MGRFLDLLCNIKRYAKHWVHLIFINSFQSLMSIHPLGHVNVLNYFFSNPMDVHIHPLALINMMPYVSFPPNLAMWLS